MSKMVLAIDIGASSGRSIIGSLDNEKITIKEIDRFSNGPNEINEVLYWDFSKLLSHIKESITKAEKYGKLNSLAIDTWGVDFGLIDKDGNMINQPVHYRDKRTKGMIDVVTKIVSKKEIFSQTGIQFMELNTLYQLFSIMKNNSFDYKNAERLLFSPDLLSYMLTGNIVAERSIASTSQIYNPIKKTWGYNLINALKINEKLFPDIVDSGTIVGNYKNVSVIAGCGHDTACAFAATPVKENKKSAILSSGTWSLLGCELSQPIINNAVLENEFTNEVGVNNTIRFLKNLNGLWIVQELRRFWNEQNISYTFDDLVRMANKSKPFQYFINPSDESFFSPGDMAERIKTFCKKTGQKTPSSHDEIIRSAFEGLAFLYADTFSSLENLTNFNFEQIHIVGGGCQNKLLNQMTANAVGIPVITGPVEATAIGNILIQLITLGEIPNLIEGRKIIEASFHDEMEIIYPESHQLWKEALKKWKILSRSI